MTENLPRRIHAFHYFAGNRIRPREKPSCFAKGDRHAFAVPKFPVPPRHRPVAVRSGNLAHRTIAADAGTATAVGWSLRVRASAGVRGQFWQIAVSDSRRPRGPRASVWRLDLLALLADASIRSRDASRCRPVHTRYPGRRIAGRKPRHGHDHPGPRAAGPPHGRSVGGRDDRACKAKGLAPGIERARARALPKIAQPV
jgi:hypothetical protein